ncbi:hypothetical protein AMECASPLE_032659 [Ameca splendens]|uniref:Uncharacterized protein n=1 Tax=Ameca splendens TaxID=208324 RepID=A0ABV0Z580_9TELE
MRSKLLGSGALSTRSGSDASLHFLPPLPLSTQRHLPISFSFSDTKRQLHVRHVHHNQRSVLKKCENCCSKCNALQLCSWTGWGNFHLLLNTVQPGSYKNYRHSSPRCSPAFYHGVSNSCLPNAVCVTAAACSTYPYSACST